MIRLQRTKTMILNYRTYQNFGHKREPVPVVTVLWHGFLTMTFLGLCIEWKKIGKLIFGDAKDEKAVAESSTEKSDSS